MIRHVSILQLAQTGKTEEGLKEMFAPELEAFQSRGISTELHQVNEYDTQLTIKALEGADVALFLHTHKGVDLLPGKMDPFLGESAFKYDGGRGRTVVHGGACPVEHGQFYLLLTHTAYLAYLLAFFSFFLLFAIILYRK